MSRDNEPTDRNGYNAEQWAPAGSAKASGAAVTAKHKECLLTETEKEVS